MSLYEKLKEVTKNGEREVFAHVKLISESDIYKSSYSSDSENTVISKSIDVR